MSAEAEKRNQFYTVRALERIATALEVVAALYADNTGTFASSVGDANAWKTLRDMVRSLPSVAAAIKDSEK